MIIKGRLLALFLAVILSLSIATPVYATNSEVITGDDEIYDDENGYYWFEIEDNVWRCTDSFGNPVQGWAELNGLTYFMGKDGIAKTGWVKDKDTGKWYYLFSADDVERNKIPDNLLGTLAKDQWIDNYYVDKTGAQIKIKK